MVRKILQTTQRIDHGTTAGANSRHYELQSDFEKGRSGGTGNRDRSTSDDSQTPVSPQPPIRPPAFHKETQNVPQR
ncbi:hypothetical protein KIN20_029898 [Parelaphostrongylus tenuis]|uniref:Uncharacterized protein n=1 Tax=Parelaphostrongylus tenuis TaxID=148309 RepID=A0AAD5WFY7_PARTN|nr:hypothetical protein KIN20_029898 [Parelaphostrongylus tenuis]